MVTVTFQGTPAEIHSDMREMLNLTKGAAATLPADLSPALKARVDVDKYKNAPDVQVDNTKLVTVGKEGVVQHKMDEVSGAMVPQTETAAPTAEKKPRTRRTKAEIEAANAAKASNGATDHAPTASETQPSRAEEAPAAASVAPPIINKEAVHQALQQVNVAVGLPKAREILSSFNVNRISEIKEDQFKDFIEKCNAAVMMA